MAVSVHSDDSQKLLEVLKKALSLPPNVVGLTLHMRVDEVVRVEVEYCPIVKMDDAEAKESSDQMGTLAGLAVRRAMARNS